MGGHTASTLVAAALLALPLATLAGATGAEVDVANIPPGVLDGGWRPLLAGGLVAWVEAEDVNSADDLERVTFRFRGPSGVHDVEGTRTLADGLKARYQAVVPPPARASSVEARIVDSHGAAATAILAAEPGPRAALDPSLPVPAQRTSDAPAPGPIPVALDGFFDAMARAGSDVLPAPAAAVGGLTSFLGQLFAPRNPAPLEPAAPAKAPQLEPAPGAATRWELGRATSR